MGLTSGQARRFYDGFGRAQDLQAFYEDRAASDLLAHGQFDQARAVLELGCGTGRLAARLLSRHLPADARYLGADISGTMTALSRGHLGRFGLAPRSSRPTAPGSSRWPRVRPVPGPLRARPARPRRVRSHRRGGPAACWAVASLTYGLTVPARLVSRAWSGVVAGAQPDRRVPAVTVLPLLDGWHIEHRCLVTAWALTSEVVIAST